MPGQGHHTPPGHLTPRQQLILTLIAEGLTNTQIAKRLGITRKTVTNYNSHMFTALGVDSRTQAVLYALHHKLIYPNLHNPPQA